MEKACEVSDISEGKMLGVTVKGNYILIANVGGNFYAVDSVCPHLGGFLPIGKLEGNTIICPVHGAEYDVTTGKMLKDVPRMIKIATGRGASIFEYIQSFNR